MAQNDVNSDDVVDILDDANESEQQFLDEKREQEEKNNENKNPVPAESTLEVASDVVDMVTSTDDGDNFVDAMGGMLAASSIINSADYDNNSACVDPIYTPEDGEYEETEFDNAREDVREEYDVLRDGVQRTAADVSGAGQSVSSNVVNAYRDSDTYQGHREIAKFTEDPYAVVAFGASSRFNQDAVTDYIYKGQNHEEVAYILKNEGADYSLSAHAVEDYHQNSEKYSDIIKRATDDTSNYLEAHRIHVSNLSVNELNSVISNGKIGDRILTSDELTVLKEHAMNKDNSSKAYSVENRKLRAENAIGNIKDKALEDSDVVQGQKIVHKGKKAVKSAATMSYYATTRGSQAIHIVSDKAGKASIKHANNRATRILEKGNVQKAAKIKEKATKKTNKIVARDEKFKNKLNSRNKREAKWKQRKNETKIHKIKRVASVVSRPGVIIVGKLVDKTGFNQTKLYKKAQQKHADKILKKNTRILNRSQRLKPIKDKLKKFFDVFASVKKFIFIGVIIFCIAGVAITTVAGAIVSVIPTASESKEDETPPAQVALNKLWNRQLALESMVRNGSSGDYSDYSVGLVKPNAYSCTLDGNYIDPSSVNTVEGYVGQHTYTGTYQYTTEETTFAGDLKPTRKKISDTAGRKYLEVVYHSNKSIVDKKTSTQKVYYNVGVEQYLGDTDFSKDGYHIAGWSSTANGKLEYGVYQTVTNKWILKNSPTIELYAIWEKNSSKTVSHEGTSSTVGDVSVVKESEATGALQNYLSTNSIQMNFAYVDKNGNTTYSIDGSNYPYNSNSFFKALMSAATVVTSNNSDNPSLYYVYCEKLFDKCINGFKGFSVDFSTVNLDGTKDTEYAYTWRNEQGYECRADAARLTAKVTIYINADLNDMIKNDDTTNDWLHRNGLDADESFDGWTLDNIGWAWSLMEFDDEEWADMGIQIPGETAGTLTESEIEAYITEITNAVGGKDAISNKRVNLLREAFADVGHFYYDYAGGHSSQGAAGMDCSGFVSYALYHGGVDLIYNYRTCAALKNSYMGSSHAQRKPGDIMVKNDAAGTATTSANHVVIYAGWFTYNGVYQEYDIECTTRKACSGVQIIPYSQRTGYQHVRAID